MSELPSFGGVAAPSLEGVALEDTPLSAEPAAPSVPAAVSVGGVGVGNPAEPISVAELRLQVHKLEGIHRLTLFVEPPIVRDLPVEQVQPFKRRGAIAALASAAALGGHHPDLLDILVALQGMRTKDGARDLQIDELVKSGIPWELIPVEHLGPPLGACFNVYRFARKVLKQDPARKGAMRSYCAPELRKFWCDSVHAEPHDFVALGAHLKSPDEGVALLYWYAHYVAREPFDESTIGDKSGAQRIAARRFMMSEIKLLVQSAPVVFVNGCESAAAADGDPHLPGVCASLADDLLKSGAAGVIGTLGPVQATDAAEVGKTIIELVKSSRGKRLPALLRELRNATYQANRGNDLSDEANAKEAARYLHTFLYIYVGDPRVSLDLDG